MTTLNNRRENPETSVIASAGAAACGAVYQVVTMLPFCMWTAISFLCVAAVILFTPQNRETETLSGLSFQSEQKSSSFVHIQARARLSPGGEMGDVCMAGELQDVEMWRTEDPSLLWSIVQGSNAVVGDGYNQLSISSLPDAPRVKRDGTSTNCPRIGMVGCFLWGSALLDIEESRAIQRNLDIHYHRWTNDQGMQKVTVTVSPAKSSAYPVPAGFKPIGWFDLSNWKRYVFDVESGRMESACVYLIEEGRERILFTTDSINYTSEATGKAAIDDVLMAAGL